MELKLSVSEPKTIDKEVMKKIILWIIALLLLGWGVRQLTVTPWGGLPGNLVFSTTRIPLPGKETMSTMIIQDKKNQVIFKGSGLYKYSWSPDGTKIAAFSGPKILLIDRQGTILQSLERDENMLGSDIAWLPDGKKILTIEYNRPAGFGTGKEPGYLFMYDVAAGLRVEFYTKDDYIFYDLTISQIGRIIFTGRLAGKEHQDEPASLYGIDPDTKQISLIKKTSGSSFIYIEFVDDGKKLAFFGNFKPFGHLVSPWALGVYDLKTGWTRYVSLWAGDIRQMTVVEDGKYLVTAEGEGKAVVLYKRSLLGGFKRPVMKPEALEHLNGFPSQDQDPAWHN